MGLATRIETYRKVIEEWVHGLYHGAIWHTATGHIEREAEDIEDEFMLACFPDAFGIPSPISYYTAELLPYLEDEFKGWERRLWDRKSYLNRKGKHF